MAKESFTNKRIKQKVLGKPHIAFIGGFWRVSPFYSGPNFNRWHLAHRYAGRMNQLKSGWYNPVNTVGGVV